MMMDHHRFNQQNKTSNVMIGGSASSSSDTTCNLSAIDPAAPDDFGGSTSDNHMNSGPVAQQPSIFVDDTFDMDYDPFTNDLDPNNPSPFPSSSYASSSKPDGVPSSGMYDFDKMVNSELGGGLETKGMIGVGNPPEGDNLKMGISSKLGDIGDDLDMQPLAYYLPNGDNGIDIGGNQSGRMVSMTSLSSSGLSRNSLVGSVGLPNQHAQGITECSDSMDMFGMPVSSGASHSNNSESSGEMNVEKLFNLPIIDMDNHNHGSLPNANNGDNNDKKSNTNTANISLSLKNVNSADSLCDSMGSLPSIGMDNISPNEPFAIQNSQGSGQMTAGQLASSMRAAMSQQPSKTLQSSMQQHATSRQQQQHAGIMERQQELYLQQRDQQQQQQQQQICQTQQDNNNPNSAAASALIHSIVNDQLSHLPQINQLTRLGESRLEQEKMKLIGRLQEIERTGSIGQQQQQQQHQQQFIFQHQQQQQQQQQLQQDIQQKQQQLQQQLQQQQQQLQQQQQQGIATASSMPSLRPGGQIIQGQQQQANAGFAMNQQMMQQQQRGMAPDLLSPRPIAVESSPTPFSVNNNVNMNNSNNSNTDNLGQQQVPSSMFANTTGNNNSSNFKIKANISSVMGSSGGKETPLLSFLRNKRGPSNSNNNMMSLAGQQQQLPVPAATTLTASIASNQSNSTFGNSIFNAAPIDFSSTSSNPFLRDQMMNDLDRSVNRDNSARGRCGGRGPAAMRRNMMQQMTSSQQISKSCKELKRYGSSSPDNYKSAGIISRHASSDNIPARRRSLTAGAAKSQNRRITLSRSNTSFGNLTKSKNGPKRDLSKIGGISSTRSLIGLGGGGSSTRSLSSDDSSGMLVPVKRGNGSGGRGGHGTKHKLGSGGVSARRMSGGGSARRMSYTNPSGSDSAAVIQQRLEDSQQQGTQHNDGWP